MQPVKSADYLSIAAVIATASIFGLTLLIAPLLPHLAVRFGARGLIVAALISTTALLVLFPLVPAVWLWFPLRLGFGIGAEILFVMSETWTNELSNDRVGGRTMAIYTASRSRL